MKLSWKTRLQKMVSMVLVFAMAVTLLVPAQASAVTPACINHDVTSVELAVGDQAELRQSGWYKRTHWSSDNETVASVSDLGVVTALAEGTTTVRGTFRLMGRFAYETAFQITVTPAREPMRVKVGENLKLDANSGRTVSWISSDAEIADVSANGDVFGISEGDVTVTAVVRNSRYAQFIYWGNIVVTTMTHYTVSVFDQYDVVFETNGGNDIATQTVLPGAKVSIPEEPVKDGCVFVGWYTTNAYTEYFNFIETQIYADTVIYARWVNIADTTDTDQDGVPDSVEEYYGTNAESNDTDLDGIPDTVEITILNGYDPLAADSDKNGISDGDEDYDKDYLTNTEEIRGGTDLALYDSDFDGLNDSEELNTYFTDPLKEDTDGDLLLDGDEILMGLDPTTVDDVRLIDQTLSNADIGESLLNGNDAVPSISGHAQAALNQKVSVFESNNPALLDNRAIVGKGIEIDMSDCQDVILSFDLKRPISVPVIMELNSANQWTLLECQQDGMKLSANIRESGVYCVMDLDALLPLLGVDMDQYYNDFLNTMPNHSLAVGVSSQQKNGPIFTEENSQNNSFGQVALDAASKEIMQTAENELMLANTAASQAEDAMGQADIVFVIDTTGSMSNVINNVANNIILFTNELKTNYSVNVNYALVDYKDIVEDGVGSTQIIKNGSSNWFTDSKIFMDTIAGLSVYGGGDTPETAIDALETARNLDYRSTAKKYIVLVTDANYKVDNTFGITSMSQEAALLKEDHIVTSVITPSAFDVDYCELYQLTGGISADIYGDFYKELLKLMDMIGEDVNKSNWILLDDFQHVALQNPLAPDSGDTDQDGVSDYNEVLPPYRTDVTPLIYWTLLKVLNVPEENLDAYFSANGNIYITVYPYTSNPVKSDTDDDGLTDNKDKNCREWDVCDRDLALFSAISYSDESAYHSESIPERNNFLDFATAKEVYRHWDLIDCSGERWVDIATHFYAETFKNGDNIIIAYRGTNGEWGEWVNNIVGVGGVNYHFEEQWAKKYAKKIASRYPNSNIYITGHSLGGYLSQIGASEILMHVKPNNLKRVAYFNGIGLKYNKLLFWTKNDVIKALKNYYNRSAENPNLISYYINGDVVSALGTHYGLKKSWNCTAAALQNHKGKYGTEGWKDFVSRYGAGNVLSWISSANVPYYYDYYGVSSISEYFHVTHELASFFNYLHQGTR